MHPPLRQNNKRRAAIAGDETTRNGESANRVSDSERCCTSQWDWEGVGSYECVLCMGRRWGRIAGYRNRHNNKCIAYTRDGKKRMGKKKKPKGKGGSRGEKREESDEGEGRK